MQCFISFDKLALYCLCCLLFYTSKVIERSRLCYIDMIVVWMCSEVYWHWLWFFDEFRYNNFRYKALGRVHNLASKTCFKTIKGYIALYCKKEEKQQRRRRAPPQYYYRSALFRTKTLVRVNITKNDITHIKHSNRRGNNKLE